MKKTLKNKFNTGTICTGNCEAWLNKMKVDLIVWKGAHICALGTLNLRLCFPLVDKFWPFPSTKPMQSSL